MKGDVVEARPSIPVDPAEDAKALRRAVEALRDGVSTAALRERFPARILEAAWRVVRGGHLLTGAPASENAPTRPRVDIEERAYRELQTALEQVRQAAAVTDARVAQARAAVLDAWRGYEDLLLHTHDETAYGLLRELVGAALERARVALGVA